MSLMAFVGAATHSALLLLGSSVCRRTWWPHEHPDVRESLLVGRAYPWLEFVAPSLSKCQTCCSCDPQSPAASHPACLLCCFRVGVVEGATDWFVDCTPSEQERTRPLASRVSASCSSRLRCRSRRSGDPASGRPWSRRWRRGESPKGDDRVGLRPRRGEPPSTSAIACPSGSHSSSCQGATYREPFYGEVQFDEASHGHHA